MAVNIPIVSDFQPKGVEQAEKSLDGLKKRSGAVFAAIGKGAAVAGVAIAAGIAASLKAAAEDQQGQAKLRKSLKNTTGATDETVDAIEDQISAMTLATGVADDKLRSAMEILARATGDPQEAMEQLGLAMDISAGTGQDLEGVSKALGKAYNGQFTALRKLGVPLDDTIVKEKDFAAAAEELNKAFGGTQETLANTAIGRMNRLKVAFSEASESIGSALLPAFEKVVGFATKTLIPAFQKVSDVFEEKGFKGVVNMFADIIKEQGPKAIEAYKQLMIDLGSWIINDGLPALKRKLGELRDALAEWIQEAAPKIGENLGKWMGDLIDWLVKKGIPELIKVGAKLAVALVKWLVDIGPAMLLGIANFAKELTTSLVQTVLDGFKNLGDKGLELGKAFANGIIDVLNKQVIKRINDLLEFTIDPPGPGKLTINPPDIPNIPKLATGGIVTRPTLALVGEAGPEAVVPLNKRNTPMGSETTNVTINVTSADPNAVVDALRRYMRQNGAVPITVAA